MKTKIKPQAKTTTQTTTFYALQVWQFDEWFTLATSADKYALVAIHAEYHPGYRNNNKFRITPS